ncbi:MAG: alcohol dehydrogenase catalytic domain-containing protein [Candidatus Aenigmarchaeota archaeon]|nr:alcohol dehydrogenase catalytic domain-containing protein [Candidatus Aenigmarchaeota archaeon]
MKVAVYYNNSDIRVEEREKPVPKDNELLVKVHSCGICGSDLVEWYRLPRAPLIPGHELGGEIAETGEIVTDFKAGDRVFVAPKIGCGECRYCRKGHQSVCPNVKKRLDGAFAEFVLVPEEMVKKAVFRLSESVSYDEATFIEPLACVYRAQKFAGVKKGDKVLIIGSGMSGILHIKLAIEKGANVTATDINQYRLDFAKRCGATAVAGGEIEGKFDVVILCAAALPAFETAWKSVDTGGTIILFTVPSPDKQVVVPVNDFWRKEVKIITSYYCGPDDLEESMKLISSKKIGVEDMITHRLPLERIQEGYRLVAEAKDSLKVIIRPNE